MEKKDYPQKLTSSILKGIPRISGFICMALFELGEITIESFLNPRYDFDMPAASFTGVARFDRETKRETIRQSIKRLVKQGVVEKTGATVKLSRKGRKLLGRIKNKAVILRKKWDGKYRLVIFDIP